LTINQAPAAVTAGGGAGSTARRIRDHGIASRLPRVDGITVSASRRRRNHRVLRDTPPHPGALANYRDLRHRHVHHHQATATVIAYGGFEGLRHG
jgi:hypothetical protein